MIFRIAYFSGIYHIIKPDDVPLTGGFATKTLAESYVKEVLKGELKNEIQKTV